MRPQKLNPAAIFSAFADRTRLRILRLLLDGEMCVGNLVAAIRVPQPTASRHLAYLRRAGLVAIRKDGQWIFYSLKRAKNPFHRSLLACLKHCFDGDAAIKSDDRRAIKIRKTGGCCP